MHLEQLQQLKQWAKDPNFQRAVQTVKHENKLRLATLLEKEYNVKINPSSIFDIQVRLLGPLEMFNLCLYIFILE